LSFSFLADQFLSDRQDFHVELRLGLTWKCPQPCAVIATWSIRFVGDLDKVRPGDQLATPLDVNAIDISGHRAQRAISM
jgi:hypothetical protein